MLLTLGKGLGRAHTARAFPRAFVTENRPRGAIFYDSIGNQFRAQTNAANSFTDQMKLYFDPVNASATQDMSTDGCSILKSVENAAGGTQFLIDDSSGADPAGWARGATYYVDVYNAMTSSATLTDYAMIVTGTNDANPSGGSTVEGHKKALRKLKDFIRADFPNVQCGFVHILHRNRNAGASDAQYQIVRAAQLQICDEDRWFKRLPDMYDLDHQDGSHFSTAEYQTNFSARLAKAIAYHFRKIPITGVFGPRVTSAVFRGGDMLLTVAQDAGTDFAAIPNAELSAKTIGLRIGTTDYKPSSVARIDATTLLCDFENAGLEDGTLENAMIGHGCMKQLSLESPEAITDNAADARPLQSGVLSVTNAHPLWDVHNLNLHLIAKTSVKTYSGEDTTVMTGATDRFNGTWHSPSDYWPGYDGSAFGNKGAITSTDDTTILISGSAFTKALTGWGGLVFEVPATVANNKYLMCFGLSSGGGNQNAFYMSSAGELWMMRNQANSPVKLSGSADLRGKKHVLIWNYKSASAVDVYLNSNAVISFDPSDNLNSWDYITLFNRTLTETGGTVGFKVAEVWHRNSAHSAGDPAVSAVICFMQSYYGLDG